MKTEIDNVVEIKDAMIELNGTINEEFPRYKGHRIKIVIIDEKNELEIEKIRKYGENEHRNNTNLDTIVGTRHKPGLKRSRNTLREYKAFMENTFNDIKCDKTWIITKNGIHIKYSSSAIYSSKHDFMWHALSYSELIRHNDEGPVLLAFLPRDSKDLVYFWLDDVLEILKKARELSKKDRVQIHLIFNKDKIYFDAKTGRENPPEVKEFTLQEQYRPWKDMRDILLDSNG